MSDRNSPTSTHKYPELLSALGAQDIIPPRGQSHRLRKSLHAPFSLPGLEAPMHCSDHSLLIISSLFSLRPQAPAAMVCVTQFHYLTLRHQESTQLVLIPCLINQ